MIEVLKQAYQLLLTEPHAPTVCDQLEIILRQAIKELESEEPVAWAVYCDGFIALPAFDTEQDALKEMQRRNKKWPHNKREVKALYTTPPQRTEQCLGFDVVIDPSMPANTMKFVAPPQRTWVGLTEQQRKEIERQSVYVDGAIRMTEAKLKENNNE